MDKQKPSFQTYLLVACLLSCCIFSASTAMAKSQTGNQTDNVFIQDNSLELGYLNNQQIYENMQNPYMADNPVTPEDKNALAFPLLTNAAGFDDKFDPKSFHKWQLVKLGPETGATCGDGSPYKFFVNRRPKTVNMVLYLEPGGACFDYPSCTGTGGLRDARNPNGIPDDYMNSLATNSITPLISTALSLLAPADHVKPVEWSSVYLPYCTGDIYSGDKVAEYKNPENPEESLLWHHNGVRNIRAVLAWLKNNMPKPPQMLATGCSAGGVGSMTNYAHIRKALDPERGYLFNDSGPVFNAPINSNRAEHPSIPLHNKIRSAWGLDNGVIDYLTDLVPAFDSDNMGSIYKGLATKFTDDRLGYTHFWADRNFSSYSYERFHPEMALTNTPADRWPLLRNRWEKDTENLISELNGYDNFGYYIPRERGFNESHCSTIITFHNTEIDELNLTIQKFITNLLDESGPVIKASETTRHDPGYFSFPLWIAERLIAGSFPTTVQPLIEPAVVHFINSKNGKGFGSIEPGSNKVTVGASHNNQWLINPVDDTKFLRFVNLGTAKVLNNEASQNKVVADTLVPNKFWGGQWYPQFTTFAADEIVLGARHGSYIYVSVDNANNLKTQHSSNVFNSASSNDKSKWKYSAKFLSELDSKPIRTRDIVTLVNRRSDTTLGHFPNYSVAHYQPSHGTQNTKWLVETMAAKDPFVRLTNANTGKSLSIEKANGQLQVDNLPIRYWSANWAVEKTAEGYASFKNRWRSRPHRFYVPEGATSGIAKEANLDKYDARAEWTYQPMFEVVDDYALIPTQED